MSKEKIKKEPDAITKEHHKFHETSEHQEVFNLLNTHLMSVPSAWLYRFYKTIPSGNCCITSRVGCHTVSRRWKWQKQGHHIFQGIPAAQWADYTQLQFSQVRIISTEMGSDQEM